MDVVRSRWAASRPARLAYGCSINDSRRELVGKVGGFTGASTWIPMDPWGPI